MLFSLALLVAGATAYYLKPSNKLEQVIDHWGEKNDLSKALLLSVLDKDMKVAECGDSGTFLFGHRDISKMEYHYAIIHDGMNTRADRLAGCRKCQQTAVEMWKKIGTEKRCFGCVETHHNSKTQMIVYKWNGKGFGWMDLEGKGDSEIDNYAICVEGAGQPWSTLNDDFDRSVEDNGASLFSSREEVSIEETSSFSATNILAIGAILASASVAVALILRRGKYAAVGDEEQKINLIA